MNEEVKELILKKIKEYETVIISRHKRPDGDAVGSTKGLHRMISAAYPDKRVFLDNSDYAAYLAFLGDEGEKPTDEDYENALVIVIDTGTADRISNPRYDKGAELVKIDHHIVDSSYGDICWIEEERSSACEMIVGLSDKTLAGALPLDKTSASFLYTGMITDSGRFRYRGTSPDTMRAAALLMEQDIDTESIYANLYMDGFDAVKFRASAVRMIKMTENGVAYIKITKKFREKHSLTLEEASNIVSVMDSIKGSLIWLAFIENDDKSIRVRLRSRFVEIQPVAARYHGGGHACSSGATVYSVKEQKALLKEADELLGRYKKENTGWI